MAYSLQSSTAERWKNKTCNVNTYNFIVGIKPRKPPNVSLSLKSLVQQGIQSWKTFKQPFNFDRLVPYAPLLPGHEQFSPALKYG